MQFEWDEEKNQTNRFKHGISFETAVKVFNDPNRIEIYDEDNSLYEDRYITIGLANKVLFVVYTERKDAIRLISARTATRYERKLYDSEI